MIDTYLWRIRDTFFKLVREDFQLQETILRAKGMSLEELKTFKRTSWAYFTTRCRRVIPERNSLLKEFDEVCSFFGPIKDAKTQEVLFRDLTKRRLLQVRLQIAMGSLSDPADGVSLYIPVECDGEEKESDGEAPLTTQWRCARGTNALEGFHRYLSSFLAHHQVGPELAYNLLRHFIFRWNARVNNVVRLPSFYRYDMVEEILDVTASLYDSPLAVFAGFRSTRCFKSTDERFGVIKTTENVTVHELPEAPASKDSPSSIWLATKEGVGTATLKISTKAEKTKFDQELPQFCRRSEDPDVYGSVDFASWAMQWNASVQAREQQLATTLPQDVIHRTTANLLQQHHKKMKKEANIRQTMDPHRQKLQEQAKDVHKQVELEPADHFRIDQPPSDQLRPRVAPPPDVLLHAGLQLALAPPTFTTQVTVNTAGRLRKRAKIHVCKTCGHAKCHGTWGTQYHPPRGGCSVPSSSYQPAERRLVGWCDCIACEQVLCQIPNSKKPKLA